MKQTSAELRRQADLLLSHTPGHKALVLLWATAAAVLSLVTGVLSHLLNTGIAGTGGLDGMGLRSILSTAQSVLGIFTALVLPFWALGYQGMVLRIARRQPVEPRSLLSGFFRFGPGLRLMVLESALYMGLCMGITYLAALVFSMTPMAQPLLAVMKPMVAQMMQDPAWLPSPAEAAAMMEAMLPMLLWTLGLCLVVVIPVSYRLRLARLRLMDDPPCGARAALSASFSLTRGSCLALLKLDLSFWWFFLLQALVVALSYADSLLPLLGLSLPFSEEIAFWLFYGLALVLQVGVYRLFYNRVSLTYALFYRSLLPEAAD